MKLSQEQAYLIALEAKRRSMESGYRSSGCPMIDPAILEQVRSEHAAKEDAKL